MNRREFIATLAVASSGALVNRVSGALGGMPPLTAGFAAKLALEPFNYSGVSLRESHWQRQYQSARDFYLSLSNDDILHGFRAEAGLPAPGRTLGGWASKNSYEIFGQWLQAMARASYAYNDTALRDKAFLLVDEWAKTIAVKADTGRHYTFEKMVGGLVDMHLYVGYPQALRYLEQITDYAIANLKRDRMPAQNLTVKWTDGYPPEWYTLSENLYRAYQVTGDDKYKQFAELWLYHAYWDKFIDSANPPGVQGFHAYSHLNTFSSAAMAYAITGEAKYLSIIKNAHDFFRAVQCYATGGYGPAEKLMPDDGALGDSLEIRIDNFETPCGSWAGFKLCKYLLEFTGEARFGDWMEALFYNGIGAALPITTNGRNFYYSSYSLGSGVKVYDQSTFTCCSGTYFQNVAEYCNLIYFKDDQGLYVNLFVPSEVTWDHAGNKIKLVQDTEFPEGETIRFNLEMAASEKFPLRFRVPGWAQDITCKINGADQSITATPGTWLDLDRNWNSGDVVELCIPLKFRTVPVDKYHPNRVAIMRGPVVLAWDTPHSPLPLVPPEKDLDKWLLAKSPGTFTVAKLDDVPIMGSFRYFYQFGEDERYRMYFDPKLRRQLW